jgi:Xaa-Pro aminopeptidase
MTVSNEPGYYADGRFGIRIENIVLVREVKTPNNFGDKGYLGFEHVTMYVALTSTERDSKPSFPFRCPIHKKLVDPDLLTAQERFWLNAYHAEILDKISPLLHSDQRALEWLKRECSPI